MEAEKGRHAYGPAYVARVVRTQNVWGGRRAVC